MKRLVRRTWVLHPVLLAAYPVLFLFAQNLREQVTIETLVAPLALVVVGATAAVVLLSLALRDIARAGLVTSLLVALTFSFGHVFEALEDWLRSPAQLLAAWAVAACFGGVLATQLRLGVVRALTAGLNVLGLVLVIFNVVPLVDYQLTELGESPTAGPAITVRAGTDASAERRPDVYFIILDRYADETTLSELYGFDNSPFLDALRERGFYVADQSNANYLKTALSLTATFSMAYLDRVPLVEQANNPGDTAPVHEMLLNGQEVQRFFKDQGYTYVHLASWWGPTWQNRMADVTFRYGNLSEFNRVLYESTALAAVDDAWTPDQVPSSAWRDRCRCAQHALYQFDRLPKIAEMRGPKFVFAHILLPHDPYVLDRSGNLVTQEQVDSRTREFNYAEHVQYANRRMLAIVDELLAGPEETDPVIVLAADEGPWPVRYFQDHWDFSWRNATLDELHEKFRILNTFYLPGVADPEAAGLYPEITPVNTFRVILNTYFDADLPLLEDRSYIFTDERHFYDWTDVTEVLNEEPGTDVRPIPTGLPPLPTPPGVY